MNLVELIERSLDWLATPQHLPGRLEMQTQRGRCLQMEIVSFAIDMPSAGGVMLRFPVFMMIMPVGSARLIQGSDRPAQNRTTTKRRSSRRATDFTDLVSYAPTEILVSTPRTESMPYPWLMRDTAHRSTLGS